MERSEKKKLLDKVHSLEKELEAVKRELDKKEKKLGDDSLKETEEELKQWKENLTYIIKHNPNAIAVYDNNLRYIVVSDRYLEDYNVKEKDIIGKHHYEVFPEIPERWREIHRRVLEGNIERNDDDFFERPDGSITYNRWECRPWFKIDGSIGGMITYTEVTTQRKLAELKLKASRENLKSLIEKIQAGIVVHESQSSIMECNRRAEELLGLTRAQLLGMDAADSYWRLVRKDGSPLPIEEFPVMRVLNTKATLKEAVIGIVKEQDAEPDWILVSGIPEFDEKGDIIKVVNTFMDITESILIERELEESRNLLQETGNMAKVGGWSFDTSTMKQRWTEEVYRLHEVPFDFDPDVEKGISFFPGESGEKISETVEKCMTKGIPYDLELRFVTAKGNKRWVHTKGRAYRENGEIVRVGGTIQDITARKEAEIALKKRERELQTANATKDKFFSIIAHDLKDPLHSIISSSDLLAKKLNEGDTEKGEMIANLINTSSKQMHNKLNDLLDWSRAQNGKINVQPVPIEIDSLVKELIHQKRNKAEEKNISITWEPEYTGIVTVDKNILKAVIDNLISNAIKFSNRNDSITLSLQALPESWLFSVADTGVGISRDRIDDLFSVARNTSTSGTEGERGTGLGLVLCREFVELHGGEIWVESEVGEGSTFYFTLPKN